MPIWYENCSYLWKERQAAQFYESMVNWQVGGIIQRMAKEGGCDTCYKHRRLYYERTKNYGDERFQDN
jgi:hypothetical protein